MNKIVKDQLSKVREADLSDFDVDNNIYHIKRKVTIRLLEDNVYIIKVLPAVFTNSLLCSNWNNNTYPPSIYLKADVSKIMVNMIKVNSISLDSKLNDTDTVWSGWLPLDQIEVIEKL